MVCLIKPQWARRDDAFTADQAELILLNAFLVWRNNEGRPGSLLNARDLHLIERYEDRITWGADEKEKRFFLYLSKKRRRLGRILLVAMTLYLVAIAWLGVLQYRRSAVTVYLRNNGYPPELYDWQDQLKVLKLREPLDL
ncbi:MAG: hypothetical protein J2P31_14205, partial [Blastocatellia bacterium]|nr:hypothetical protein [Blastocatellia bacterium]